MKRKIFLSTVLLGAIGAILLKPNTQILPNSTLTPGSINTAITQDNVGQNICNPNWSTKSIRPSTSYTNKLKIQQIKEYGYKDTNPADYEEDHLVSLELGGSPTDPKNLWPESYKDTPNARNKDRVENYLHAQVCSGQITLQEAQEGISKDWVLIYQNIPKTLGSVNEEIDQDDN